MTGGKFLNSRPVTQALLRLVLDDLSTILTYDISTVHYYIVITILTYDTSTVPYYIVMYGC